MVISLTEEHRKIFSNRVNWYKYKIKKKILPSIESYIGTIEKSDIFLSAGCGRGEEVKALRDLGIKCIGIDLRDNYSANIAHWTEKKLPCIVADGRYMPFKNEVFAYCLSIEVIEHIGQDKAHEKRIKEKEKYANELMRVVKRGGGIFLSTPNKKFPIDIAHAGMRKKVVGGFKLAGIRIHFPFETFLVSMSELENLFLQAKKLSPLSPLDYVNWEFKHFTKHAIIRYVVFPLGKLYTQLLDRFQFLLKTSLNSHLILVIEK